MALRIAAPFSCTAQTTGTSAVTDKRNLQPALERMLKEIAAEARSTRRFTGKDAFADEVMTALRNVPRHRFVPGQLQDSAYDNRPLPIGHGQTISQPYIVALMTDLLAPGPGHRLLEVGTGCGYQTAILATLAAEVYSVEIVAPLAEQSAALLAELGYDNIHTRIGDGYYGWPEHAPYDGIIVTAAAPEVPDALIEQLKPGARLVIPVGTPYSSQDLLLIEKEANGKIRRKSVLPVAFVPLTGEREHRN